MPAPSERNRPIEQMNEQQIREITVGAPRVVNGPVTLVPYDPAWPDRYAREAAKIRAALGDRVVDLQHIGSTAVPGLPAKPIIDIQLLVENSGDESTYADDLVAAGFTLHIREPEWDEHRTFKGSDPAVNLHVFSRGSRQAERHIRFRDWLRAHDDDRDLYAATKTDLAGQTWQYMQNYADAKNSIIDDILARAGNTTPRI